MAGIWTLVRGDEVIATLTETEFDFPWVFATLEATPAFAEFVPLFDRELELLDADDDDVEAWEAVYEQITSVLDLRNPDGVAVTYLLHIDGNEAWFRFIAPGGEDEVAPVTRSGSGE